MARLMMMRRAVRACRRRPRERSSEIFERCCCFPIVASMRDYSGGSCSTRSMKVAIVGASSKVGRCLAMCLKQSSLIDELALYDTVPMRGLPLELSHMDTRCTNCAKPGAETDLNAVLGDAKVVAITTERKHLSEEVKSLQLLVPNLVRCCPKALVALVSRSVNTLLPTLFELYKKSGLFESGRLLGVLSLYQVRANGLAAEILEIDPEFVTVPVIGGGCPRSCVPIFSQTQPCAEFTTEELSRLMHEVKTMDERIALAYGAPNTRHSSESSSLCAGFAAARFCISLCKALRDERGVVECAYTRSCLVPELKYVGAPLALGPCGIQKHLAVSRLTNQECNAFYEAIPEIKKAIALGEMLALGCDSSTEYCPAPERCSALPPYQPNVTA